MKEAGKGTIHSFLQAHFQFLNSARRHQKILWRPGSCKLALLQTDTLAKLALWQNILKNAHWHMVFRVIR